MTVEEMQGRMSQREYAHHVGLQKVHNYEHEKAVKDAERKAKARPNRSR